jgi:hypothetical protein
VNTEPMMPASSEMTIAMMSLNVLFIFIDGLSHSLKIDSQVQPCDI